MPELPEVEAIRRMLVSNVAGKDIVDTSLFLSRAVKQGELTSLVGLTIQGVDRRGKYLLFRCSEGVVVYVHLRMTGVFFWKPLDEPINSHIRFAWHFSDGKLLFQDVRTLGGMWISDAEHPPWKKMGWEPFDENLTAEMIYGAFQKRKITVKQGLLDQTIIAGIGNIYASEVLYKTGINPFVLTNALSYEQVKILLKSIREILSAAIAASGTTFKDFRLSDGSKGEFAAFLKVYNKQGEPCSWCGTKIERVVIAARSTYYCPACQPMPAED